MMKRGQTRELDFRAVCIAIQPSAAAWKVLLAVDSETYPLDPVDARVLADALVEAANAMDVQRT